MAKRTLKEVVYTCTDYLNKRCTHKQTITFFPDDPILPVTCCVKCRAGFGTELNAMLGQGIGMFPGKALTIEHQ